MCYSIFSLFRQVVELDFLYPSEGIHKRWDNGYRITSTAATLDQAALILSVPKRKTVDETQETLRTSAFPSTHVKVEIAPFPLTVHILHMPLTCPSLLKVEGDQCYVCMNNMLWVWMPN